MITAEPRRSAIGRPPPAIEPRELKDQLLWSALILDVREEQFFRAGHIDGSVNLPDSNTKALVQKVQFTTKTVILVWSIPSCGGDGTR